MKFEANFGWVAEIVAIMVKILEKKCQLTKFVEMGFVYIATFAKIRTVINHFHVFPTQNDPFPLKHYKNT